MILRARALPRFLVLFELLLWRLLLVFDKTHLGFPCFRRLLEYVLEFILRSNSLHFPILFLHIFHLLSVVIIHPYLVHNVHDFIV